jgi:hypothetical protein
MFSKIIAGREMATRLGRSVRIWAVLVSLAGFWTAGGSDAFAQASGEAASAAASNPTGVTGFRYNKLWTTKYGPAAADVVIGPSNMLSCKPPGGQDLSYALCYYSGPAVAVGAAGNPALPCVLSKDGKSATCSCYKLSTTEYPTQPYKVDINAILNRDVFLRTVKACGQDGAGCGGTSSVTAPACMAVANGTMIPGRKTISVFSPVKIQRYPASSSGANSTSCSSGKYAGCMTAPCTDMGNKDSSGNPVVACQCPVYDGVHQIGQGDAPCDANALTPAGTGSGRQYVWSGRRSVSSKP